MIIEEMETIKEKSVWYESNPDFIEFIRREYIRVWNNTFDVNLKIIDLMSNVYCASNIYVSKWKLTLSYKTKLDIHINSPSKKTRGPIWNLRIELALQLWDILWIINEFSYGKTENVFHIWRFRSYILSVSEYLS